MDLLNWMLGRFGQVHCSPTLFYIISYLKDFFWFSLNKQNYFKHFSLTVCLENYSWDQKHQKSQGSSFSKKADVFLWNKANMYLLLSVDSTLDSCKSVCIIWSVIDVAATTVGLMRTIYSDGKHNLIDIINHEKMVKILFVWPTSHARLMILEIWLF